MSANKKDKVEIIKQEMLRSDLPEFKSGDTLKVHTKIREGNKERVQVFQGAVIAVKGSPCSVQSTFTVRKMSYNVGVEKTFLLHSPRIEKIEIISRGDVRRSKLYFLRDRSGKSARIKTRFEQADSVNKTNDEAPKEAKADTKKEAAPKAEAKSETTTAAPAA